LATLATATAAGAALPGRLFEDACVDAVVDGICFAGFGLDDVVVGGHFSYRAADAAAHAHAATKATMATSALATAGLALYLRRGKGGCILGGSGHAKGEAKQDCG
jgi:hypothetical protein